jgi:2OG-Fe(II) oxygenase superfamily
MISRLMIRLTWLLPFVAMASRDHPLHRTLRVQNQAEEAIDIAWIDPNTGNAIPLGEPLPAGEVISYDSFVNHTFLLQRHPSSCETEGTPESRTPNVPSSNTKEAYDSLFVTVTPEEGEQLVLVQKDFHLERVLHLEEPPPVEVPLRTDVSEMVQNCKQQAELKKYTHPETIRQFIVTCLEQKTTDLLVLYNEELSFQRELRKTVAHWSENYTCADPMRTTTPAQRNTTWAYQDSSDAPRVVRHVGILHEHSASQIHVIENFISPEECQAIQEAANPILHRGTVADGKGGSTMSKNRKAWQAGISVQDYKNPKDPIANVKRRLYAYANHAAGYNMTLDGQEDIMSIQYFGLNSSTVGRPSKVVVHDDDVLTTPDQYTPHCDGDCTNELHKTGSRVATMVMYCDVPEVGGATNFQQANVYVQPVKGAAAFFSYMNADTYLHDEGFTTHSGCPVFVGTKRIAVQWMRVGSII